MSKPHSRTTPFSKKLRKQIEEYAEAVAADIKDCGCEQPTPEGEIMWIRSQPTELDNLMAQHDVPDELMDLVAARIRCPACGEQLTRYSDVGVEWWMEVRHKKRIEEASEKYHPALVDFAEHLRSGRRLRGLHPIARELLREIDGFPRGQVIDAEWCRARRDRRKVLTSDDLRPPPDRALRRGSLQPSRSEPVVLGGERGAGRSRGREGR